jgi:hypothetical protein
MTVRCVCKFLKLFDTYCLTLKNFSWLLEFLAICPALTPAIFLTNQVVCLKTFPNLETNFLRAIYTCYVRSVVA